MTQPLSFLISALLGDAQSQNPFSLAAAYSSGGSLNLWINKNGQVRVIDGWTRQNTVAFATDTGASAARIRALYQYRRIAAGVTTRQVLFALDDAVNEWELHYSTDLGVTRTLIVDLGAGSINTIPDFATFGDELFITNGVMVPRMWNGTSLTSVGATQLVAPTLADSGAGPLNGGYKYRVLPIKANKTRKVASIESAVLAIQGKRITVSWTADTDLDVLGYEVWRTTGSGLDYYLVTYSDGRLVVSYEDSLSDRDLIIRPALAVIAAHGDAPPTGTYFVVAHKGRLWWLRTDTNPRRVWWSDPGDPDSVYTERNYTECTDAKTLGDQLTGGTGEFEGMIVIWLERSVWVISGTGTIAGNEIDWRKRRTNAKTGTPTARSVMRVPRGAVYYDQDGRQQTVERNMLAYLTPEQDLRLFDGSSDFIFSFAKADTLARLNRAQAHKSYAYEDTERGMMVWCFPIDASTEPNYSVAWNYLYGTMHEWDGTNFAHVVPAENSSGETVLLAGEARTATGGLIYQLWNGNNRDSGTIEGTLMTKPLHLPIYQDGPPDLRYEKRVEAVILLFDVDASPTAVTVGFLTHDAADGATPTISRASVSATARVRVPARMIATDTNPGRYFHNEGLRLRITSTVTTGSWTLRAMEIQYVVLKGATR